MRSPEPASSRWVSSGVADSTHCHSVPVHLYSARRDWREKRRRTNTMDR